MSYKISIILPIFNVEKYLKAALDSIVNQTFNFNELEVLMVNDCSTDSSGEIMDEYAKKYDNFIAIHLDKNSGTAGKPRNMGLDNASGEYIMFLDSDDELIEDVCEVLYKKIKESDADIVTGNAICIQPNKEIVDINYSDDYYEFNPNRNLKLFKTFRIWGTLYKKSLIEDNKIRCIRAATNDDTHFVYNCYLHANKIVYINDYMGVKYYERDVGEFESLTHKMSKFNIISTYNAFIEILDLIEKSNPTEDFVYDPFISLFYSRFANKWEMTSKDKIDVFNIIRKYLKKSSYVVKLPIHHKILHFFVKHNLNYLLIVVQQIYSSVLSSRVSKKFLFSKVGRNEVK